MKHKYVMSGGLALSEDKDLRKLSELAEKGWILEDMVGTFYKLKKGSPEKLVYALDYQADYDEEYFHIFASAGWTHVTTCSNTIHFFLLLVEPNPFIRIKLNMQINTQL